MRLLSLVLLAAVIWTGCVRAGVRHVPDAPPVPLPSVPGDFDLLEGRFTVTFHPDRGLIEGEGVLWGKMYGPEALVPFRIHPRALVERVTLPDRTPLPFRRDGDRVEVSVPLHPHWGRHVGVVVTWVVKLGGPSMDGPLTPFVGDCGAYLPSDLLWHPRGIGNDLATWRWSVRAPRTWKVLPVGDKVERFVEAGFQCGRFRVDDATAGCAIMAGAFDVRGRTPWWHGDVEVLVPPGVESNLPAHAADVTRVLDFFRRQLGDPVFTGLTLCHLPGPGGEAPFRAATEGTLMAVSSPPPRVTGPYLEFLGTELARNWFERRLRFRDHLGEALTVYCGMLALRKYDGRDEFLRSARDKAARYRAAASVGVDVRPSAIRGLGENVDRGAYEVVVRAKIPLLILCLEQIAGGVKPFVRILRTLGTHFPQGGPIGWPEFLDVVEKRVGVDLSTFALLYVDGPGLPPEADSFVGFDVLPDGDGREEGR